MSLKIIGWKKNVFRTIIVVLILLVAGFILRTAIWENEYYTSKEGSERATTLNVRDYEEKEEIIEIRPTENEIKEYDVAEGYPRYINIPKLNMSKVRVVEVGTKKDKSAVNRLNAPNNIYDAGWYNKSALPGTDGIVLLDGHSGGPREYDGVFRHLPELKAGDAIEIEVGGGKKYTYEVVTSLSKTIAEAGRYMYDILKTKIDNTETLVMITCTGDWSQKDYTYMSRQFVRAKLVKIA